MRKARDSAKARDRVQTRVGSVLGSTGCHPVVSGSLPGTSSHSNAGARNTKGFSASCREGQASSLCSPARFITHTKKLRDVETPLANFFASGVLALCEKLGPILWQLPPNLEWNKERVSQLKARAWTKIDISWPLRYATSKGGQIFQPLTFQCILPLRGTMWIGRSMRRLLKLQSSR